MIVWALLMLLVGLDLDAYRWKKRVLLQVGGAAPTGETPGGYAERDLIRLHGNDPDLLRKMGSADGKTIWILIGKDGGEKARWTKAPQAAELYRLIDAMPMRQSEMKRSR